MYMYIHRVCSLRLTTDGWTVRTPISPILYLHKNLMCVSLPLSRVAKNTWHYGSGKFSPCVFASPLWEVPKTSKTLGVTVVNIGPYRDHSQAVFIEWLREPGPPGLLGRCGSYGWKNLFHERSWWYGVSWLFESPEDPSMAYVFLATKRSQSSDCIGWQVVCLDFLLNWIDARLSLDTPAHYADMHLHINIDNMLCACSI